MTQITDSSMKIRVDLFVVPILIVFSIATFLTTSNLDPHLFNSDALYLPVLMNNLIHQNGSLSDWYLTPAPYFFPDMLVFYISAMATADLFWQLLIYGCLQVFLTFVIVLSVFKQLKLKNYLLASAVLCVVMVSLAALSIGPYPYLLVSAFHFGSFMSTLAVASCWLAYTRADRNYKKWIFICLLCSLAYFSALSDNLFQAEAIIPFFASVVVFNLRNFRANHKQFLTMLGVVAAAFLGSYSYKFLVAHQTRNNAYLRPYKLLDNWDVIGPILKQFASQNLIYTALAFFTIAFCVYYVFKLLTERELPSQEKQNGWLVCFFMLSVFSNISLVLLIDIYPAERYLIAFYTLPAVLFIYLFARAIESFSEKVAHRFFWTIIFFIIAFVSAKNYLANGVRYKHYPDAVSCVDRALAEQNAFNGLSEYWNAKYLQALSTLQIEIAQFDADLAEKRWITSDKFFRDKYDFIVLSENDGERFPNAEYMTKNLGNPTLEVNCYPFTVLFYKNKITPSKDFPKTNFSYK